MERLAFGGFLFPRCLGLGFVLELVLGDEGRRSEAASPGWRLSWGGISQESCPKGAPALTRSPQLQTYTRVCSREPGSNGKTSLAWFSPLQPSFWEQGMLLHLEGNSRSLLPSFHCSNNAPSSAAFSPPALFSPAQKAKPRRLLLNAQGLWTDLSPEPGGSCFPPAAWPRRLEGRFGAQPGSLPYSATWVVYKHNC